MKFLKTIDLFLIIFFIISISGCVFNSDERTISSIKDTARDVNERMLHAIEYKNADELKELFSEKLIESDKNLDEEIAAAFDFFQGNIISKNAVMFDEEGAKDDGVWTRYFVYGDNRNIITDNDKEYVIITSHVVVYDSKPERIGLAKILIKDSDGNRYQIGDFYLVNPELKR